MVVAPFSSRFTLGKSLAPNKVISGITYSGCLLLLLQPLGGRVLRNEDPLPYPGPIRTAALGPEHVQRAHADPGIFSEFFGGE